MGAIVVGFVIGCLVTWFVYWLVHKARIHAKDNQIEARNRDIAGLRGGISILERQKDELTRRLQDTKDEALEGPLFPLEKTRESIYVTSTLISVKEGEFYNSDELSIDPAQSVVVMCAFRRAPHVRITMGLRLNRFNIDGVSDVLVASASQDPIEGVVTWQIGQADQRGARRVRMIWATGFSGGDFVGSDQLIRNLTLVGVGPMEINRIEVETYR